MAKKNGVIVHNSVTVSIGDYKYEVLKGLDGKVIGRRCLVDAPPGAPNFERVQANNLPSEELKDAFANFAGKSRAELGLA